MIRMDAHRLLNLRPTSRNRLNRRLLNLRLLDLRSAKRR
jgi:hypothetical protein